MQFSTPKARRLCTWQNWILAFFQKKTFNQRAFLPKNVQLHLPKQISGYGTDFVDKTLTKPELIS